MNKKLLLNVPLILALVGIVGHVQAETSSDYHSYGKVGFTMGDGSTPPVNPNHPDPNHPTKPQNPDGTTPAPGGSGPLTIDFASSLDFGTHKISNENQTYSASAQRYFDKSEVTPNFVQVTDSRGTLSGWALTVTETEQFTQVAGGPQKYKILDGSSLSFKKPIAEAQNPKTPPTSSEVVHLVPGVETIVAKAIKGNGAGTWAIKWGEQNELTKDNLNPNVTLTVPGSTPKDAAAYTTTLKWTLSELPNNL